MFLSARVGRKSRIENFGLVMILRKIAKVSLTANFVDVIEAKFCLVVYCISGRESEPDSTTDSIIDGSQRLAAASIQ